VPRKNRLTFWTGVETATVFSPYSPAECSDRLNARLDVERRQRSRDYEISGRADASFLQMTIHRPNSSPGEGGGGRAYLTGFMSEHNGGTRIRCRLGASDGLAVCLGVAIFAIWAIFIAAVAQDFAAFWNGSPLLVLAVPFGLSLLAGSITHLVSESARRRSRKLLHLLNSTLSSGEQHVDREAAIEDLWRNA